jgi:hypothetical protein
MAVSKFILRSMCAGAPSKFAALAIFACFATVDVGAAQSNSQTAITQSIANFKANPDQLLGQYPNAGAELVSRIREIAINDPTALDTIIGLLAKATKDQKIAIASGLAQAARIVVRTDQPYATRIQQAIADTKDLDVVAAYAAASGDVAIAAAGGAGAGSAGASGGQTNGLGGASGQGGAAEAINGSSVNTGQFSFTSSVGGGGGASTTNNNTTTLTPTSTTTTTTSP